MAVFSLNAFTQAPEPDWIIDFETDDDLADYMEDFEDYAVAVDSGIASWTYILDGSFRSDEEIGALSYPSQIIDDATLTDLPGFRGKVYMGDQNSFIDIKPSYFQAKKAAFSLSFWMAWLGPDETEAIPEGGTYSAGSIGQWTGFVSVYSLESDGSLISNPNWFGHNDGESKFEAFGLPANVGCGPALGKADSVYHHVVFTFDAAANSCITYIDGIQAHEWTGETDITANIPEFTASVENVGIQIGTKYMGSGGHQYIHQRNGGKSAELLLDNISFFESVISADDVAAIFAAESGGVAFGNVFTENNALGIYPNPANATISLNKLSDITIYSLSGQVEMQLTNVQNNISISQLAQGVYFVKDEAGNVSKLIVK